MREPGPSRLTVRLGETLRDLCATPLATVSELAELGERPQRRWFPTADGIAAAEDANEGDADLLRSAPVSRQWFRLLAERLDAAYAVRLSRTDKQVLDLLADWPLCTGEQLAGLMGGVRRRRVNQALRRLRRRRLVQRADEGGGSVLSDEGLTVLARRDRAAVGPVLDRWTPQQHEGVHIGTSLRSLASQRDHQRGIVGFASRLSAEVGALPDEYELFDPLPTHRSQISYDAEGARQLLLPDVSFQLAHLGYFEWCLFEYERRATTPRRLPTRLRSYERYFKSRYAANDHGGQPPLVLFLFESERAEAGFLHVASFLPGVLLASTTTAVLEERGVLEQSWRLPPPHAPRRRFLADLRIVATCPDDP